jgi:two-component system NtrC family sensor kinase
MKMKMILLIICLWGNYAHGQIINFDSITNALIHSKDAKDKLRNVQFLASGYLYSNPDSAISYTRKEIVIAKELKSDSSLAVALTHYAILLNLTGDFSTAIWYGIISLKMEENSKNTIAIATTCYYLSSFYLTAEDYQDAVSYCLKAKTLFESGVDTSYSKIKISNKLPFYSLPAFRYLSILLHLAYIYDRMDKPDSALKYAQFVNQSYLKIFGKINWADIPYIFGNIYAKKGNFDKALEYYRSGNEIAYHEESYPDVIDNSSGMAALFLKMNQPDSTIYYSNKVLHASLFDQYLSGKLDALYKLSNAYKIKGEKDSASKYLELVIATKDKLFNQQKVMQMRSLTLNEQLRQQDKEEEKKAYTERLKTYFFIGGLLAVCIIAIILYRNNKHKQRANLLLQQQKEKVETTLSELKATQAQLIQSEKMASLGELTAGIAHEIQNPLNFINNFSEVNTELIDELASEIDKGNIDELKSISNDIKENEQKINHHGKRADAIVKGMLQHSRSSAGVKEPTDINALCDEYLRLSYHALRAKDKSSNVVPIAIGITTDFDKNIDKVNIKPQDVGRVLLNFFNNAFYAVNEKQKTSDENYKPLVSVQTKKQKYSVFITVSDNGNGIPQKIVDKIFQPFFTTKPTGEGTGLGLSLSYDIVKAHGGEIEIETKEGEYADFIICLPI